MAKAKRGLGGNGVSALFMNSKIPEPKESQDQTITEVPFGADSTAPKTQAGSLDSAKDSGTQKAPESPSGENAALGADSTQNFTEFQRSAKAETLSFDLISEDEVSPIPKNRQSVQKSAENPAPDGLSVDEFGQLFAKIDALIPNPQQPREEFDEEKLGELADSIREHGILQAITVEDAGDGKFYIIAGERRTRAAKMAGLSKIPVQVRKYDDQKKLEVALIENIQRADLNAVEEARAYYKLMQISGLSQDQIAARVGKNRSTVANAIRLLKLPEDMQDALIEQKITPGHARALLAVKDSADRKLLFAKIVEGGMNVRRAEEMAAKLNSGSARKNAPQKPSAKSRDPNFSEIEQKFIESLGTKVSLNGSMEKGKIEIDYYSKDDLDRIYSLILGENFGN